jgi:hypothetical protein
MPSGTIRDDRGGQTRINPGQNASLMRHPAEVNRLQEEVCVENLFSRTR